MLLPVALNLKGKRCLVVGGGPVAERKTRALLECEALVHVVSPELCIGFAPLRERFEYSRRPFAVGDCDGATLVFACTDSTKVNAEVAADAARYRAWCNLADDSAASDFHSAAMVRRGDILFAITTQGGSPALARHLKTKIEACIGDEYAQLLEIMSVLRRDASHDAGEEQSVRADKWREILASDALELLRRGDRRSAEDVVRRIWETTQ